jgi:uncharacterized cupin superfamily protein/predicted RNA-binding Zn-ribbon protein involved in translation (DUF1610 family)
MDKTSIDDLEPDAIGGVERRRLPDPLGTTDVAINHYRVPPGNGLPGGLHAHADQEEIFVVVEGTATFETLEGRVTVDAGEAIRFAPGEFQSGTNDAADALVVLGMGAPRETDDVRIPVACPACDHEDLRLETGHGDGDDDGNENEDTEDGPGISFVCPDCGAEHVPESCPECGSDALTVTTETDADTRTAVVCECGATFESPPLRSR